MGWTGVAASGGVWASGGWAQRLACPCGWALRLHRPGSRRPNTLVDEGVKNIRASHYHTERLQPVPDGNRVLVGGKHLGKSAIHVW